MTQERLAALKASKDEFQLEFYGNKNPKCPHCGHDCEIVKQEWYHLYEEGEHEVTCPQCDLPFRVSTLVSYSFTTENQE